MDNPYPYSEDNKRYQTWNYYTKRHYGHRLYKVPLDADFTCPNRDGTVGYGGCVFCAGGSSSFPGHTSIDLWQQYLERKPIFENKWPTGQPLAYFQSYSNTYGTLEHIKELYAPFIEAPEIAGLVIATRTDCLNDDILGYLVAVSQKKEVWLELGLQSIHDQTLKEMNRGHDYASFRKMIRQVAKTPLKTSVHIIDGWPSETREMQLETAKAVGKMRVNAVKIHMLHVLRGTQLATRYEQEYFPLLRKEEYVSLVAEQLTYLNPRMVIERITGDGLPSQLITPLWTVKKISVINDIDKEMVRRNWWQGKNWKK